MRQPLFFLLIWTLHLSVQVLDNLNLIFNPIELLVDWKDDLICLNHLLGKFLEFWYSANKIRVKILIELL